MATTSERVEFLTVRELASYLRVSLRTAYQLVYDGGVPAARVGGQYRIPRAELERRLTESMTSQVDRGDAVRLATIPDMREPGFSRAQGSRDDDAGESYSVD
jgi:excisionase family DNA binding protein